MALRVTGEPGKALPAEILDQILERTDGRAVVPRGVDQDNAGIRPASPMLAITTSLRARCRRLRSPANLHDSLMARLDRLATVKELAQIGAVIGREFSHELIAAVADRPEEQLESGLDQLVGSELVFRRGSPPHATYSFKHALVKDAAYRVVAQVEAPAAARSPRAGLRGAVSGCRRNPTRAARIPPDRGRARRARGGWMGAGRSHGPRPLGDARGGELALSGRRTAPGNAVIARSTAP